MRTPDATLSLAERAANAVAIEVDRRRQGDKPDTRFDAYIDYLADSGEAMATWQWPGETELKRRYGTP